LTPSEALLGEVVAERNMMIDVATGTPINSVEDYYRSRRRRVKSALEAAGIDDPNKFESLWDWYKYWRTELPTYSGRRTYVHGVYRPIIQRLATRAPEPVPAREPTGWQKVDRTLEKARAALSSARTEEEFQTVGLLCREVLISLGQAVFDPFRHRTSDGVIPSDSDGARRVGAFLATELGGGAHEETRKHAKAAMDLAVALQHRRTAGFRMAALCLEATSSVVTICSISSGRRDPS
jgi:hypothetical protein